jgi:hypothetical protein
MNICTNMDASRPAPDDVNGTESSVGWAEGQVTLRLGSPADARQLRRLAMLDSSKPLTQPILLAEVDGAVAAALSLSTGVGAADPSQRTAGLVELLRVRAVQLALAA